MTQNIYDDESFFAGYSTLERSTLGLAGAPEWSTTRELVGEIAEKNVLDLGCGFGWFARWAAEQGASSVLGLDVSSKMLARAEAETRDPRVRYERQDLAGLELEAASFDLAYSSLCLHYLEDVGKLFHSVHQALVPAGRLVFTIEHPIYSAPTESGFVDASPSTRTWPLSRYLDEGPRVKDWFAPGVVKYHRTVGTYVRELLAAGFVLRSLEDWGPSVAQINERRQSLGHNDRGGDWRGERDRPAFLIVSADRRPVDLTHR